MASLQPSPYKILGVSKDAQLPEIRSAHRKLVLKCHPDKVQDPTLKAAKQDEFQKVQQAYELLSDENERAKYDDSVKLAELRSQMAAKGMSANTSAPRSAPRAYEVNIRTAEPRPDTFKTTSYRTTYAAPKMYTQPTSRSYEEDLHKSSPIFEETRSARRAASYEKPSREDDRERERRRRKEEERERERIADMRREELRAQEKRERKAAERAAEKAAAEKDARRRERKAQEKAEKERDKERRSATEDKARRHKTAYVEPYGEEETYIPKSDKKKSSSSKKYEEKEKDRPAVAAAAAAPTVDTVNKMTANMHLAASYMDKSRRTQPPLSRAQTFNEGSIRYATVPAVPTPPAITPFAPPPAPGTEDDGRRTKSRRSSETKRDKSSHKKSSPLKEPPVPQSPEVFTASPSSRHMSQFATSPAGGSPPKHAGISKAATFHEYSRPPPGPTRAQTFTYGLEPYSRGRTRSRQQPQVLSEDSESEEEPRSRRSNRHKAIDPEPIPLDYGRGTTAHRYTVNTNGRAVPVAGYYREESPPPRKAYYTEMRPPMPPRESSSYSSNGFKVKTANRYTTDDIQYSNIPHRYTQEYAC